MEKVQRAYADLGSAQIHYRRSQGTAPGSLPPLICFHQSPSSGRIFEQLMPLMATDREVFAPDTPGFGQSDPPETPPDIGDYARTMAEFIAHLGFGCVDLLGYHTGAAIAIDLAVNSPALVRRLILIGIPLFDAAQTASFAEQTWPEPMRADGGHLVTEWQRTMAWRESGQSDRLIARNFVDKLLPGDLASWGARAAHRYPMAAMLPRLTQPVLAIRAKDDLWESTERAFGLIRDVQTLDIAEHGFGLLQITPGRLAGAAREFFG